MAPRTRKSEHFKQDAARNSTNNNKAESSGQPASSSSTSSSTTTRRSSRRQASTPQTTIRTLTQNATKSVSGSVDNEENGNMSENSDFQNASTPGPSNTPKTAIAKSIGNKRHAVEKRLSATPKKQRKEDEDLLELDEVTMDMEKDQVYQEEEQLRKSDHDTKVEDEDSGVDYIDDPEYNPDYYSSDDDQVWEEVPVPGFTQQQDVVAEDYEEEEEQMSGPWQYNAVEIVFDKPLEKVKKSSNRGVTKEERMIRVLIHQTHLLCLIANGLCRNRWINSPKMHTVALSLVPDHIASSVQMVHDNPVREVNALQVLALWWRDSFVTTGPGIESVPYADLDVVGVEAAFPANKGESIKKRKNLQRRLLNRNGSNDVCSQLFTAICRSLGLKTRLVESLQACTFKVTLPKDESTRTGAEASTSTASTIRKGKKKNEVELDESDTTRGSRVVLSTPHRLPKRPKLPPSNKLSDNYVTDVTRRYTSQWTSVTKKIRVQPAGPSGFDWWAQTMAGLANPSPSVEEDIEEAELQQAEASERMPTKLGDFNNHPIYALERHIKKFEVLHPKLPVLGHIRGEAIYPRSCVKQVRSKENWLKRARRIKNGEVIPVKLIKSRPATIFQMRLQQQAKISGGSKSDKMALDEDDNGSQGEPSAENGDQVALFGEWQTEPYQPPWVVDGKVPRNQYGRQDVFTPAMVPIGGTHLKGRNIARVARQLGVDFVEAVTGFEFQSRRSVPVIQGIIVPTECAELVMDAYREVVQHADQEALKRKRAEVYGRWRKLIKGVVLRSRLLEEYGDSMLVAGEDDDKDSWAPAEDDEDEEVGGGGNGNGMPSSSRGSAVAREKSKDRPEPTLAHEESDSGGGFMLD
ncbi:hypothetical protein BGX24_007235 [Mortierella sp. AD032]|nr:hypothetical protein BGX24_007235 [Mortierella sp. AD032]